MFKEITIGGQPVELLSNAATPIRYQQIFHKDLIKSLMDASKERSIAVSMAPELAFVMYQQAKKADMMTLNEDSFITWLEGFGGMDFIEAADNIWEVYYGTNVSESEPKKKRGAQSAK